MLENVLKQLNSISKCRYKLAGSYGLTHLEKCSMECTGISSLSFGNTKKELYYQIRTLLDWHSFEKNSKQDYVKNCTHHDIFNIRNNEKINASNIRLYHNEYRCLTCSKKFTKEQYEKSIIPKTSDELRSMRLKK